MAYSDLEKKKAYHREYYHRKLGGKGGSYMERDKSNVCECGASIPENRMEAHVNGLYHTRMIKRQEHLKKRQEQLEKIETKN